MHVPGTGWSLCPLLHHGMCRGARAAPPETPRKDVLAYLEDRMKEGECCVPVPHSKELLAWLKHDSAAKKMKY
eukprot:1141262-Pelagomonas_calceolata.AAC.7